MILIHVSFCIYPAAFTSNSVSIYASKVKALVVAVDYVVISSGGRYGELIFIMVAINAVGLTDNQNVTHRVGGLHLFSEG